MPLSRFSLYLILLVFIRPAKGQELLFRNAEIDLPSQESYNIMQDSRGYIWIGTETGLCRYSSNLLDVFNEKNGLPEQSCYAVKEDRRGVVWIMTSAGRILNFNNDSLYETAINYKFQKQFYRNNTQIYLLQCAADSLLFHTMSNSFKAYPPGGWIDSMGVVPANCHYYFFFWHNMLVSWKGSGQIRSISPMQRYIEIIVEAGGRQKRISLPNRKNYLPGWRVITATNRFGTSFIAFDDLLVQLNADLSYRTYHLPNMILSLYCDPDGGLWAGTYKKGVFYYRDIEHSDYYLNNLSGFSVTGTCQDREKGIWCTTLEEGVFYCRSKEVVHYGSIEGMNKKAELLKEVNGGIYASSSVGDILRLKGRSVSKYPIRQNGSYPLGDLLPYGNGWLVSSKDMLVQTDSEFKNVRNLTIYGTGMPSGSKQLLRGPGGRIFSVNVSSLYEVMGGRVVERDNANRHSLACICYRGRDNELLAGTKRGLYRVDTRRFSWTNMGVNDYILKLQRGPMGEVWIITRHLGMLVMRGDSIVPVPWAAQLPTKRFFDIIEDPYHVLWVSCAKGLIRVEGSHEKPFVRVYDMTSGLAMNEIYNLAADSEYLYMSTVKGISYFPLKADLSNNIAPLVFIRSVFIGNRQIKYQPGEPLLLPWDHSIRVGVDGLCYKQGKQPVLQYILKGQDTNTRYQDGDEIMLGRLSPGSYELQVYALNSDGKRSMQPAIMQFRIQTPFWQTWWFIGCIILSGSVMLYWLVSRKIRQVRGKAQEITRINHLIAEYRLTALQAQMNPHFIFNAINSIQTYILDNQSQLAYDYLAKFSRLVRLVLYHAKDRTLTLEQELEMLQTYTELEQLRFNHKFDVVLDVDPKLDIYQTELPPMLLQPYVENAIWHGLLPLKGKRKGVLKIKMTRRGEELVVVIEDNGVGRHSRKPEKPVDHKSLGMMLNEQRMELLSHMPEYQGATIQVTDLCDELGAPSGTRVEIHLLLMPEVAE